MRENKLKTEESKDEDDVTEDICICTFKYRSGSIQLKHF